MICACLSGVIYGKGVREVENFDWDWRFARYGLQPDGSRKDEPKGLSDPQYDDSGWRLLICPTTGVWRVLSVQTLRVSPENCPGVE